MLRAVRFLFSTGLGVEALGLGDADLMMMAGSFLGWQPLIVAFFLSVLPGLLFAGVHLVRRWAKTRSKSTVKANISLVNHQPALEVEGQPLPLDELGATCSRLVQENKRQLLLEATEFQDSAIKVVDQIKDAASQAGLKVRDVAHEVPPQLPGRILRFLVSFFRPQAKPAINVEVFHKNGLVAVKIGEKETSLEESGAMLQELKGRRLTVSLDVQNLEKWMDRVIGNLRLAARQAGIEEIIRTDNAIPFGPSLAVGLILSLLAWPWIVSQTHLAFIMFNTVLILAFTGICAVFMLAASYGIRVIRLMRG